MFGVIASASHRSHWSQKLLPKTDGPTKRQARGSRNFNITTGNGHSEKEHPREVKDLVLHNNLLGNHWWNPNGWWSCSEKQPAQCESTLAHVLFSLTLPFRLLPSLPPPPHLPSYPLPTFLGVYALVWVGKRARWKMSLDYQHGAFPPWIIKIISEYDCLIL